MADTTKPFSDRDANQTLQHSYNDVNATLGVDGFIIGKVGRKIDVTISTTTILNDSQTFAFSESGTALYSIKLIFTDGARQELLSVERIS